jgi:RNA polymerase sigma-70 factor, ECF subfamily
MTMRTGMADAAASFDPLRPRLVRVAYRMLGSVADAEGVVQEAFIRWIGANRAEVREPEAFLRRTVTRLCLDQLKSARQRRETYVGPWLPEPIVEENEEDDITLPLMLALERLSPLERAAFLLHDVFGIGFDEIAVTIQAALSLAGSSPPVPGPTSAKHDPVFRWRSSAALKSPTPSLPLRATAT